MSEHGQPSDLAWEIKIIDEHIFYMSDSRLNILGGSDVQQ